MRVTLQRADFGNWLLVADDGRTVLVQSDWDWPLLAREFGFVPCRQCNATDGTIDCAHQTAAQMIGEAWDWLDSHSGESFVDPGYFDDWSES